MKCRQLPYDFWPQVNIHHPQGRISDGGVSVNSSFSTALVNNTLNMPAPKCLPNSNVLTPFNIVGDDAFPLRSNILKPFSKRDLSEAECVCNYRLSRGRRVTENAFGIMTNTFRLLYTPIMLAPARVEKVILAICALHNFLRSTARSSYICPFLEDENSNNTQLLQVQSSNNRNSTVDAKKVREQLKEYFLGPGQVSWQLESCYAY